MQIVAAEEDKRTSTERDTVSSAAPRCHARQDEVDDDPMAAHGRRAGPWTWRQRVSPTDIGHTNHLR